MASDHFVTFFDAAASRAAAVASFVEHARARKQPVAVFATGAHWECIVEAVISKGGDLSTAFTDGTLVFRDAELALYDISRGGYPDRVLFDEYLRSVLQRFGSVRPVNVYGELVDVLASRGDFAAAVRLEGLWNDLLRREQIRLMCGYDATHFAPDGSSARLRAICDCHRETRMASEDVLGRWLLREGNIPVGELVNS
jgi:hypothetical protein